MERGGFVNTNLRKKNWPGAKIVSGAIPGWSPGCSESTRTLGRIYQRVTWCRLIRLVIANWPPEPLAEEFFGEHISGKTFFDNLQKVMARNPQSVALMEMCCLCLRSGYKGRYVVAAEGLQSFTDAAPDRIPRICEGAGLLVIDPYGVAQNNPSIRA